MYEEFYNLSRKPFSLTPDPDFLYLGTQHAHALATLQYGLMSEAGVTVLTGEVGTGKTTLLREALRQVDGQCSVGVITNTHAEFGDLLAWVLMAFDIDDGETRDKTKMYHRLLEYLGEQHAAGRRVVLVVDEAQNLGLAQLEELRLLSNLNLGDGIVLQLVLVGQPELAANLEKNELRQFSQRISVEYDIALLDLEQTSDYITHRLETVGGTPALFDRIARFAVYYHSRGIPRLINNICDLSLTYAFGDGKPNVDLQMIEKVMRGKKITRHHLEGSPAGPCAERLRDKLFNRSGIDIGAVNDDVDRQQRSRRS